MYPTWLTYYLKYLIDRMLAIPRRARHRTIYGEQYDENRVLLAARDHILGHRHKANRRFNDYIALMAMCTGLGYILLLIFLYVFYYCYTNRWFTTTSYKKTYGIDVRFMQ